MIQEATQLRLIDEAIEGRRRDRISDETLTFALTGFDNLGLQLLAERRPDLKGLFLMGTHVADDGFEAINRFRNLEELKVEGTRLSAAALSKIDPTLPLRELSIHSGMISQEGFANVAQCLTLRSFSFGEVVSVRRVRTGHWPGRPIDDSLLELAPLTQLVELDARGNIIDGLGIRAIETMTQLQSLCLAHTLAPSPWLARLSVLTRLKSLHPGRTGLDDEAFEALCALSELEALFLTDVPITDASIRKLPRFRKLKALALEDLQISQDACECLGEIQTLEWFEGNIDGIPQAFWESLTESIPQLWVHP